MEPPTEKEIQRVNEITAKIDDYDLQLSPQEKTKVIAEVELVCSKLQACSEASITAPGSAVALQATARAIALQAIALVEAVRSPGFSWHPQALRDAGIEDYMLMVFVGAAIDAAAPG